MNCQGLLFFAPSEVAFKFEVRRLLAHGYEEDGQGSTKNWSQETPYARQNSTSQGLVFCRWSVFCVSLKPVFSASGFCVIGTLGFRSALVRRAFCLLAPSAFDSQWQLQTGLWCIAPGPLFLRFAADCLVSFVHVLIVLKRICNRGLLVAESAGMPRS